MRSENHLRNNIFSHIYVEREAFAYPITANIIKHFSSAKIVEIDHYKDVFNRSRQNYSLQHNSQNLILAVQKGNAIYPGAPVCQSFGNEHFYYTSQMMNCIYDCEYCYLKGMYPSGNMVIFVNPQDVFAEIEEMLGKHSMYICVSYDTDLLALEPVLGYVQKWIDFVKQHENLTIEVRTKSANAAIWQELDLTGASERVIFAFTLSPEEAAGTYEHNTPSLTQRIKSAKAAQQLGYTIRLCLDPMIYIENWKTCYKGMVDEIFREIDADRLYDVSVGSFRISSDYLKKMQKNMPASVITRFPYENTDGYYHYPEQLMNGMEEYMVDLLLEHMEKEKIFRWQ